MTQTPNEPKIGEQMNSIKYKFLNAVNRAKYGRTFGKAVAEGSFDNYILLLTAQSGNTEYLKYLVQTNNPSQERKDHALATAVQHNQEGTATVLLDAGANPMAGDGLLLRQAESVWGGHSNIVAILRNRALKSEIADPARKAILVPTAPPKP